MNQINNIPERPMRVGDARAVARPAAAFTLADVFAAVRRSPLLVLLLTALGGGGAYVVAKIMPDSYEATGAIGGSFVSSDIEDYYVNPFELGYGFYIGWKSDFIGKQALEKMKDGRNRKKVTFEWNAEDVVKVIASAFQPGEDHYKWIDFPQPNYASTSADMPSSSQTAIYSLICVSLRMEQISSTADAPRSFAS